MAHLLAPLPKRWGSIFVRLSSHHWSRELQALGHTVRLMPPAYVKPAVVLDLVKPRRHPQQCIDCGSTLHVTPSVSAADLMHAAPPLYGWSILLSPLDVFRVGSSMAKPKRLDSVTCLSFLTMPSKIVSPRFR